MTIAPAADRPAESAVAVLPEVEIILPLSNLIDKEAEAARLRKALADLDKQLAAVQAKLRNESFTSRAPAEVVAQQQRQGGRAACPAAWRSQAVLGEDD